MLKNKGWSDGIADDEIQRLVGLFLTSVPHLEEAMVKLLGRLLLLPSPATDVSRQVWHSLQSHRVRVTMMNNLLATAFVHVTKPQVYNVAINHFDSIMKRRHEYAHGLWFSNQSGSTYLSPTGVESVVDYGARRKVLATDVATLIAEVHETHALITQALDTPDEGQPVPHG
ncbi:MAG: hypothetical protein ACO1OG_02270 [Devosia sp.]